MFSQLVCSRRALGSSSAITPDPSLDAGHRCHFSGCFLIMKFGREVLFRTIDLD
jgi:hypothetical protein